jgi:hypothetical protein
LIPGGDKVKNQVTLDNCGYVFTTEAHRSVRRQVEVDSKKGFVGLSNEVVAYDSQATAAKALVEFRASMKTCRKGVYWTPRVAGSKPLRYLSFRSSTAPGLPIEDNILVSFKVNEQGQSDTFYVSYILQRSGSYLDAIYLETKVAPNRAESNVAVTLAVVTGRRLAAISDSGTTTT